ncbi:MAG: ROK family protein [Pleurocapsa minor GSE-CHR-MK-17-07R]|nr:ROK family protein [Pleurocapsa minor GSE-CHR-MK 17-07R]
MKPVVIGLDIGGTKLAAHLTDGTPWSLAETARPTPAAVRPNVLVGLSAGSEAHAAALAAGRAALLAEAIDLCQSLMATAREHDLHVAAIGIGSAGQIDPVSGDVLDANDNLVGWRGTPLARAVSDACGVPVAAENDVRAMALGEVTHGAARGLKNVLCITVGTGIGGALVQDGRIWHGPHFSAGEIGYLYAGAGETIETLYAGPSIARRYSGQHARHAPLTLVEIASRAEAGDAACAQAITAAAHDLGQVLAPVFALLDPEAVVIGGGVPEIGPRWWDPFIASVRAVPVRGAQHMDILRAALGPRAGMIGAGVLAAHKAGIA